ncbi:MAG TPA: F0F1 ATP synthase subunit A [Gemmatimonadales bacterium]|nr:F0F1 ATP synthase subunit A [Gemmatimonadales bacterium]
MTSNEPGPFSIAEMVFHHTGDAHELDFAPLFTIHLPQWEPVHLLGLTIDLSPTRHVVFMILAAVLTFVMLRAAANGIARAQREGRAPGGYAGAMEAFVLYVRNEIAISNIGEDDGPRYAPLIITLFFFILMGNLLGMLPWGASVTGNLAVTGALAVLSFLVIEIGGMVKLGPKGYMRTIFPHIPGMHGIGGLVMTIAMGPIEILSKLVKPIALAIRLFGNMLAGHFVILSLFGIVFLFGSLEYFRWGIGIATALVVLGVMLLELFVAFLQAYVFALLSAVFIGLMQHEH